MHELSSIRHRTLLWLALCPSHRTNIGIVTVVVTLEAQDCHVLVVVLSILSQQLIPLIRREGWLLTISGFVAGLTTVVTPDSCHGLLEHTTYTSARCAHFLFVGPILLVGEVRQNLQGGISVSHHAFDMSKLTARPIWAEAKHIVDTDLLRDVDKGAHALPHT